MENTALSPERLGYLFQAQPAHFKTTPPEGKGPRRFVGVAYSGEAVRHPFWGRVVFDLSSTRAHDPTPVLLNHSDNMRVGKARLGFDDGRIDIADGTLLDNEHARQVAADSDQGFPWQMSVYIEPGSVEEVQPGSEAEVNGRTVTGPAQVWRNNFIREVSFTPCGVDYNTTAQAMSAARAAFGTQPQPQEDRSMNVDELKAQVDSLKAKLSAAEQAADIEKARADAAEQAVADATKAARLSAVRDLFARTGQEYSDDAAAPYLDMPDAAFSAVRDQMLTLAKPAGGNRDDSPLFSAQAAGGRDPGKDEGNTQEVQPMKLSALYDQINQSAA